MQPVPPPDGSLQAEAAAYNRWREALGRAFTPYHDWLEANAQLDMGQSIRFFDLIETINKGRLTVAFLGDESRGKSALLNALLFPDREGGFLPSGEGGVTRCPTEIVYDPKEEPCLKLLSMKSRFRETSIPQLRKSAVEWSRLPLDPASAEATRKTVSALAETKRLKAKEARMIGLAPMTSATPVADDDPVDVPAWRYAVLNCPHPLLASGLAFLDLPGPDDLSADPELGISVLPRVDAVVFVTAADTGVASGDVDAWARFARPLAAPKIAVINRIDRLEGWAQGGAGVDNAIRERVEAVAKAFHLDGSRIFALSATEALQGRSAGDAAREARSGIGALENYLAREVVPARRRTICRLFNDEIGPQLASSRASIARELADNEALAGELKGQAGKSREVVAKLWQKISAEKAAYSAALAEYKVNHADLGARRDKLMALLDPIQLDAMLATSAKSLEGSWTTAGLQKGMRDLAKSMSADFERVFETSEGIKTLMQGAYDTFIAKFAFQPMVIPALDLEPHRAKLRQLIVDTDAFAKDPVNIIAMEKGFVVKKFHRTLVAQARALFTHAKVESERWLRAVTLPLETQMRDHKQQLQSRLDTLSKINEKSSGIGERLAELAKAGEELARQRATVEELAALVVYEEPAGTAPASSGSGTAAAPAAGGAPARAESASDEPLISDDLMAGLSP